MWDRRHVIDDYFRDEETLVAYFHFGKDGKYKGMSYYFASGDGCGFCYDGTVQSTVKIEKGRIDGARRKAQRSVLGPEDRRAGGALGLRHAAAGRRRRTGQDLRRVPRRAQRQRGALTRCSTRRTGAARPERRRGRRPPAGESPDQELQGDEGLRQGRPRAAPGRRRDRDHEGEERGALHPHRRHLACLQRDPAGEPGRVAARREHPILSIELRQSGQAALARTAAQARSARVRAVLWWRGCRPAH